MKKIALLSNINIDPLKSHFQKNDSFSLYLAGYNQWQTDLLNQVSGLYLFQPNFVFIYLNIDELKSDITDLFSAINVFNETKPDTQFIISNISHPPFSTLTYLSSDEDIDIEINNQLKKYATSKNNVFIFDFNRLINYHGYNLLFDDKYWYLGRMKFSNYGFKMLAKELNIVLDCLQGKTKKILILDLDNTLWGGIVGEDGWQNLLISNEGIGKIYSDFQRNIKQLRQNGVILALCSKNNEADAREAFDKNLNMQLNWDDFVIKMINWKQKSENIIEIASSLNIGLNDMVFIDDNPVEREFVSQNIPELIVPEFPKNIAKLNRWFIDEVVYPYFSKKNRTNEDLDKSNQYKRNIERNLKKDKLNYDDFISQLDIKSHLNKADNNSYQRIAQLTQKTNQFNLSIKRYTDVEIKNKIEQPDNIVYSCEYEDKFGKEGIIGCAIIQTKNETAFLDSFMLSCRVLGRKVEFLFLNDIINELKNTEIKYIEACYSETDRNSMVKNFLIDFGFTTDNEILYIKKIKN